jgi:hypothetical protein
MRRLLATAVLLVAVTGCVGPAPSVDSYEGKAAHTARDALSQLQTARLAVEHSGGMPAAYLETVLVDAEESYSSVEAAFTSIQPPDDPAADRLRDELDPMLSDGSDGMTELRILARRGDTAELRSAAAKLAELAEGLDRFGEEHAG